MNLTETDAVTGKVSINSLKTDVVFKNKLTLSVLSNSQKSAQITY